MMHPRYFLTSTLLVAGVPETSTFAFGRFASLDDAERAAREKYFSEVSGVRIETKYEAVSYILERLIVRTLRIAFGVTLAALAYAFLWDSNSNLGDVPLAQMTLDMLFGGLFRGVLLMASGWLAWHSAFGEGPDAKYR